MKKILALDLGTKTGYAFNNAPGEFQKGTWRLASDKEINIQGKNRMSRRCDCRAIRLYETLHAINADIVVFEDVQFASSTYQVQLWATFRGVVWAAFYGRSPAVVIECVPTGTLKKYATGNGGANKEMMAAALYRVSPDLKNDNLDDNAVDAVLLWRWAAEHLNQV
jgi:Holliday junction resolvasome RuvABC endonuclease subunit